MSKLKTDLFCIDDEPDILVLMRAVASMGQQAGARGPSMDHLGDRIYQYDNLRTEAIQTRRKFSEADASEPIRRSMTDGRLALEITVDMFRELVGDGYWESVAIAEERLGKKKDFVSTRDIPKENRWMQPADVETGGRYWCRDVEKTVPVFEIKIIEDSDPNPLSWDVEENWISSSMYRAFGEGGQIKPLSWYEDNDFHVRKKT